MLTDVPRVLRNYGTSEQTEIANTTPAQLRAMDFAAGSMRPKVEAVTRFAELTGDMGAIGALEDVAEILAGKAGTIVTPSGRWPLDNGLS